MLDPSAVIVHDVSWCGSGQLTSCRLGENRRVAGDEERGQQFVVQLLGKRPPQVVGLIPCSPRWSSGGGLAVTGTILAALFTGTVTSPHWTAHQTTQFHSATTTAALTLTTLAAALVAYGTVRSHRA